MLKTKKTQCTDAYENSSIYAFLSALVNEDSFTIIITIIALKFTSDAGKIMYPSQI
jgi:hypothetical protein